MVISITSVMISVWRRVRVVIMRVAWHGRAASMVIWVLWSQIRVAMASFVASLTVATSMHRGAVVAMRHTAGHCVPTVTSFYFIMASLTTHIVAGSGASVFARLVMTVKAWLALLRRKDTILDAACIIMAALLHACLPTLL